MSPAIRVYKILSKNFFEYESDNPDLYTVVKAENEGEKSEKNVSGGLFKILIEYILQITN